MASAITINGSGGPRVRNLVIGSNFQVTGAKTSLIKALRRQQANLLFSAAGLVD